MKKVVTIIIICVLLITTGVLAYTTYNLYQENQELQEDLDDLKDEKKSSSNKNDNNSNKVNANFKEENNNKDNVVDDNIHNEKEEIETGKADEYSNIREINYSVLEGMLLEEHSFILLVSQTGCSHCESYRPVLNKVLKENKITAYEIDIRKLTEKERKSFNEFATVSGTPTTIFVKNGQEESIPYRLIGNVSSDKIVSRLKDLGYIK